jgi:hypothetical protein
MDAKGAVLSGSFLAALLTTLTMALPAPVVADPVMADPVMAQADPVMAAPVVVQAAPVVADHVMAQKAHVMADPEMAATEVDSVSSWTEPVASFRVSGFVKTDYWVDSRSVVAAREDLFLLYPAGRLPDTEGADLNGDPVFNFSAITSRVAAHLSGPIAFGARTSGLIEADFSGVTNADINGFRLRHAYMMLEWDQVDLLLGQWWHPMFSVEAVPSVVSLNTGAPFQPFIRNPQASLRLKQGRSVFLFAAIAQRDNASDGPRGTSPDYLRQGLWPNVHLQWIHHGETVSGGLAMDYKSLRPRLVNGSGVKTTGRIRTHALMGYFRYQKDLLEVKGKAIWGQNLSEHLLMGGYAEQDVLPGGHIEYIGLNHLMAWGNLLYGDRIRAGLFMGWSKNLGARQEITGNYYGRGHDIGFVYRLAPSVVFTSGKVSLGTELEWTVAGYGTPDSHGRVMDAKGVGNLRLLVSGLYYF